MFTHLFNRSRRNRTVRRRTPYPVLRLSPLDERIVPAAAVTAVKTGAMLTITGADNNTADDNQQIQISGSNGSVMLIGLNGTLVNGQPITFFNGVNAVTCNMNKGDDVVRAFGLSLPGTLNISGGAGNNSVFIRGGSTLGAVKVSNADGNDIVNFGNDNTENVVKGAVKLDMGGGMNGVALGAVAQDITRLGSFTYTAKAGNDTLYSDGVSLQVDGAMTLNLGDDTNSIDLVAKSTKFGAALNITGGVNDDHYVLGSSQNQAEFQAKAVTIRTGDGQNVVKFESPSVLIEGALSYTGGAGADSLYAGSAGMLIGLNVVGTLSFKGGNGDNKLDVTAATATNLKGLAVTGGAGDDSCDFKGGTVGIYGTASFSGGDGDNVFRLQAVDSFVMGATSYTGGTGADLACFGSTSAGTLFQSTNVTVNAGAGINSVYFNAEKTAINGALGFASGAGHDIVGIGEFGFAKEFSSTGGLTANFGAGSSSVRMLTQKLAIGGMVTITGGAGKDSLQIGSLVGSAELKGIALNLGGGDNNISLAAPTSNKGPLTVNTTWGKDSLFVNGAAFNTTGVTTINLGSGDNDLTFDNAAGIAFFGNLAVTTGDGDDTIKLTGQSIFAKSLTFNLGNGMNSIDVVHDGGTIAGGLTINGGEGADFINVRAMNQVTIGGPVAIAGKGSYNSLYLANLDMHGPLTLQGGDDMNLIGMNRLISDGLVAINVGMGNDSITVNDCTFNKAVTVSTGLGKDEVSVEQASNNNQPTTFKSAATFNLGGDADVLRLDTGSNDGISFLGALKVDGGAGQDTISAGLQVVLAQPLAKLGVEVGP